MSASCAVVECRRSHHARGWCTLHYQRWLNTGDPLGLLQPSVLNVPPVCICDEPLDVSNIGECQSCFRPFTAYFAEQRDGWRARLGMAAACSGVTESASTDLAGPRPPAGSITAQKAATQ